MEYDTDCARGRYCIRQSNSWSLCCPRNSDLACCLEAAECGQDDVVSAGDWGATSAQVLRAVVEVEVRMGDQEYTRELTSSCYRPS